jgi:hypothetical protein
MTGASEGRIIGVIGTCSAGSCSRLAVQHVELVTAAGEIAGVVCARCARATASALFLLEMIA